MKAASAALAILLISAQSFGFEDDGEKTTKVKTAPVKLKDLVLQLPSTWKKLPNASSMRLATYAVPAAEGDSEDGELSVFSFAGGGGDVKPNLSRWVGQFDAEGRTSKIVRGRAGDDDYYLAEIAGTYKKPVGPPVLRKTESAPDYSMLGLIYVLKDKGVYYLKLTGPTKTIKAQADSFRQSFDADPKSEEAFEI